MDHQNNKNKNPEPKGEMDFSFFERELIDLCRETHSPNEIGECLERLDELEEYLGRMVQKREELGAKIRRFHTIFSYEFHYNDNPGNKSLENIDMVSILKNRSGNCAGLCFLFLVLSRRLKIPSFGILSPGHIFISINQGEFEFWLEPVDVRSWPGMLRKRFDRCYNIPERKENCYFTPLFDKETLSIFCSNRAMSHWLSLEKWEEAKGDLNRSVQWFPRNGWHWYNLSIILNRSREKDEAETALQNAFEYDPFFPYLLKVHKQMNQWD